MNDQATTPMTEPSPGDQCPVCACTVLDYGRPWCSAWCDERRRRSRRELEVVEP